MLFIFPFLILTLSWQVHALPCVSQIRNLLKPRSLFSVLKARENDFLTIEGTANIHSMNVQLQLAQKWHSTDSINSRTTHLEELVPFLFSHLNYVKSAFSLSETSGEDLDRLTVWKLFKEEAQKLKQEKRLSYRRWINFNLRLAILATPQAHRRKIFSFSTTENSIRDAWGQWTTDQGIEQFYKKNYYGLKGTSFSDLLDRFPQIVLIPVIGGNLSYSALNKIFTSRTYVLGLSHRPVEADNRLMWPDEFFDHDRAHAALIDRVITDWSENKTEKVKKEIVNFHRRFMNGIEKLSVVERRPLEIIFYRLTHERPDLLYSVLKNHTLPFYFRIGLPKKDWQNFKAIVFNPEES